MTTYFVSTTNDLITAVRSAANGDTISLAAGTYSGVTLSAVNKTGNVTVTSTDLTHPATLTDLTVKNSSGLTFSGLELFVTRDAPFQVLTSSRIALDSLDVHGTLNDSSNDDHRGMIVRDSTDVTVSNSHFHELTSALTHLNSNNITFSGNSFDLIRDDGILGGGSSNVMVSNNVFTNFDHVGDVHPDAIQFWTTNTTAAASNITVTGNVFTRGSGAAVQGIFFNDEVGTLGYQNVTITNNEIIGALYNGIAVLHADSVAITGNIVVGADDQISWIAARNVSAGMVNNNIASNYSITDSSVQESGNVLTTLLSSSVLDTLSASDLSASVAAALQAPTIDLGNLALPAGISLLGFVDGASQNGLSYTFTEVQVDGTNGNDTLRAGTVGSYHIYGYDGSDSLIGNRSGGPNILEGGAGNDSYTIYQASDLIVEKPGEGSDSIYTYVSYTLPSNVEGMRAMAGGLTLIGNGDANVLLAHDAGSILQGLGGDDVLQGGAGNDFLYAGEGNDRVSGGAGNDYLDGSAGNDVLYGGDGDDIILAGDGNDTIEGGAGVDILTGGSGADTFAYREAHFTPGNLAASTDVITDFNAAEGDRIALSMIDAKPASTADDAFTFIGSQSFHNVAGELRFALDGDGITVLGDTNGDGVADLAIHLAGLTSITASSFFL